jgi:citronellol/citronellal dehydrogenase
MQMIPGIDLALCRTPVIMADAAYCIFTAAGLETGNFYIDDTVLSTHGITDLDRYAVTPGNKNFLPDFFVD